MEIYWNSNISLPNIYYHCLRNMMPLLQTITTSPHHHTHTAGKLTPLTYWVVFFLYIYRLYPFYNHLVLASKVSHVRKSASRNALSKLTLRTTSALRWKLRPQQLMSIEYVYSPFSKYAPRWEIWNVEGCIWQVIAVSTPKLRIQFELVSWIHSYAILVTMQFCQATHITHKHYQLERYFVFMSVAHCQNSLCVRTAAFACGESKIDSCYFGHQINILNFIAAFVFNFPMQKSSGSGAKLNCFRHATNIKVFGLRIIWEPMEKSVWWQETFSWVPKKWTGENENVSWPSFK